MHSYPAHLLAVSTPLLLISGIFRGHADTRAPLLATLVAAAANLLLDPLLMFAPFHLGLRGAGAATAAAQYMCVFTYIALLYQRRAQVRLASPSTWSVATFLPTAGKVLAANGALLVRTLSLMLCWATASGRAVRMGAAHAAAHQVSLSLMLALALVAEAPAIAGQVLVARFTASGRHDRARRILWRLLQINLFGSVVLGSVLALGMGSGLPQFMAPGAADVQALLLQTLPTVALMQPLIATTLLAEGALVGAGDFRWLGVSMLVATAVSARAILSVSTAAGAGTGVRDLWRGGLTLLFCSRLALASFRLADRRNGPLWRDRQATA